MSVCVTSTILPNYVIETAHYFGYEHTGVFLKTPGHGMSIHVNISLSNHPY